MRAPIGQYWALSPALLVGPLRDCKSKARKFSFTGKFQFSALSYWPRNRSVNTARFRHTVKTVLSVNKLLVILNTLVSYENWVVPQCNNIDNCLCVLAVDLKIFWSPANSEACKHTKQSISQSVSQSVSQAVTGHFQVTLCFRLKMRQTLKLWNFLCITDVWNICGDCQLFFHRNLCFGGNIQVYRLWIHAIF